MIIILLALHDTTPIKKVTFQKERNLNLINITTYSLFLEISLNMIEKKSVHQKRENSMKIFKYLRTQKRAGTSETC